MSDEAAFLSALAANPADDTARLVYADWLDDHSENAKAEYLRLVARAADGPTDFPRLRELALSFDAGWSATVGARFEVVYTGSPDAWLLEIGHTLAKQARCSHGERREFLRAAPAVIADALDPGGAEEAAESLMAAVVAEVGDPHDLASEYARDRARLFHDQTAGGTRSWFAARPMACRRPPVPARFGVRLASPSHTPGPRPVQNVDALAGPLAALLGLDPDDARRVLYAGEEVWVESGMSFVEAVPVAARHRSALKRHPVANLLAGVVALELAACPFPPEFDPNEPAS